MRKIEKQMLQAVQNNTAWHGGNTSVVVCTNSNGTKFVDVFLHGNHIATVDNGELTVNSKTLAQWPTPTTKSRLRALGANVATRKGITYLNGVAV